MRKNLILLLGILLLLSGCGNATATEYRENVQDVSKKILDNSDDIETLLNNYSIIWQYSIENRNPVPVETMANFTGMDEDTVREHFEINAAGNVTNDFSSNVHALKSYYQAIGDIGQIEEVSDEIKDKITELNNPPKDYEKVYEELLDLYNLSEEYKEMLLNPSGNIQQFNETKSELSSEVSSKFKRIEVITPKDD